MISKESLFDRDKVDRALSEIESTIDTYLKTCVLNGDRRLSLFYYTNEFELRDRDLSQIVVKKSGSKPFLIINHHFYNMDIEYDRLKAMVDEYSKEGYVIKEREIEEGLFEIVFDLS